MLRANGRSLPGSSMNSVSLRLRLLARSIRISSLRRHSRRAALSAALLAAACAPLPERVGHPSTWVPSPNFNDRRPSYVVLHHTTDATVEQALRTLTDPLREVSVHYLIGRDGHIYQLVDERRRAWHAGQSRWGSDADLNSSSIGIELDNTGSEPFPAEQIDALLRLLADLKARYRIPTENFLGHADVAPGRKVDPSAWFPWQQLAQRGYGLWCDPPLPEAPIGFDAELGLQSLGYDLGRRDAAVSAFKLHYVQTTVDSSLTPGDRDLVYCLIQARARSRAEEAR
jgi:N-acetylmuramoyl-L-alanine amidase